VTKNNFYTGVTTGKVANDAVATRGLSRSGSTPNQGLDTLVLGRFAHIRTD